MALITRLALCCGLLVAAFSTDAGAGKPAAEIQLLVSFSSGEGDSLTTDGFTAPGYTAGYAHGLENVLALIEGAGNSRFSTQNQLNALAERRMCIDFGSQFSDRGTLPPFNDGSSRQCVNVLQPMHAYGTGDMSLAALRYAQSVEKLTRFGWDDGGYRYRLGYGTDMDQDGYVDAPPVRATCIAATADGQCRAWVLAPSTDGTGALFRVKLSTNRRGGVQEGVPEFIGTFVMPFAQTLERK